MKKTLSIFSVICLIIGISCFVFILIMGYEPLLSRNVFFWQIFFNILFQPALLFILPLFICILLLVINIIVIFKSFRKENTDSKKLLFRRIHYISAGAIFFLMAFLLANTLREVARRTSCVGNLKMIGLSMRMYSNVYDGHFPHLDGVEGLELLRKTDFLNTPQCYVCPTSGTKPGKTGEPLTDKTCDYIYIGGYSESDSPDIAIVYDKKHNHCQYGNILFIDGHVGRFLGKDWQKNINPNKANSE